MTFYCTAPKVWPPAKPVEELQPEQVVGDICWAEFASPEERSAHVIEVHPEWSEAVGLVRRRREPPPRRPVPDVPVKPPPPEPPPPPPPPPEDGRKSMACYVCSTMKRCLPTQLADGTWAWMCEGCDDPTG